VKRGNLDGFSFQLQSEVMMNNGEIQGLRDVISTAGGKKSKISLGF
jgi:hypothetical protein